MMAENYMLKETLSYPSLIREVIAPLRAQAQSVLSDEIIRNIDCIYIYGSGDSLNAAVCAAQSFWEYAGVPAYPLNAMQASRYAAPCLDRTRAARTLTICISNSGEAARSVEASMAMHAAGTISMAITAKPNSRVGKAVDYILHAPVPAFEPSPIPVPGIRSFALPVVGLYLFALHMAQVRGTMTKDEAAAVEQELQQLPDVIEDAFTRGDAVLRKFADLCSKCERMEFFGAGPCRGAADFGVSKVLEAQGYSVLSQDIEEFAHQTFFSVDTHRLPSVLLVPSKGRCLSRAKEILFVLQKLERPVLVITDDEAVVADESGVRSLCLKKSVSESLISLVFACIMTYLSSVMPLRASDIYMHGHAGVYQEDGLPTVRGSKVDVVL